MTAPGILWLTRDLRSFNPEKQAEQHDPEGRYRRRWLAGWMGAPWARAQADLESAAPSWKLSQVWNAGGAMCVKSGREHALQAYADFRTQQH